MPRGSDMARAIQLIKMFERGDVTVRMVADRFGISRSSAARMITNACCVLPIVEVGTYKSKCKPCIIYGLMEE